MKTATANLPYAHEAEVVDPRGRKSRSYVVRAEGAFDVPILEPTATCVLERHGRDGKVSSYATYEADGRLFARPEDSGSAKVDGGYGDLFALPSPLLPENGIGRPLPDVKGGYAGLMTLDGLLASRSRDGAGAQGAPTLVSHDAPFRRMEAQDAYSECMGYVGTDLVARVPLEPCWRVVKVGEMVVVRPAFSPDFRGVAFHYAADRLEQAMATARSLGGDVVLSRDDLDVLRPDLLRFDQSVVRAMRVREKVAQAFAAGERHAFEILRVPSRGWDEHDVFAYLSLVDAVRSPTYALDREWAARMLAAMVRLDERTMGTSGQALSAFMPILSQLTMEIVVYAEHGAKEDPAMAADVATILAGGDPAMDEADFAAMP